MTQTDLIRELDSYRQKMVSELRRLRSAHAVTFEKAGVKRASRGNPLGHYRLTSAQRAAAVTALSATPDPRDLRPGQAWVLASVGSPEVPDLMGVCATASDAAEARWIARLEGESSAFVFVFDDLAEPTAADGLAAALGEVGIRASTGVVRGVHSAPEFLAHAAALRMRRRDGPGDQ